MKVTGSVQIKRGIYQLMARVTAPDGTVCQKMKSTGIRVDAPGVREQKANKRAAEWMLVTYLEELSRDTPSSTIQFLTKLEQWLEKKRNSIRQDTYESYMSNYIVHIKPYFAPKLYGLTDISPRVLSEYTDAKLAEGLSAASIRKHLVLINGMFRDAVKYGEALSNPCTGIRVKDNRPAFTGKAYTPEIAKKLLSVVSGDLIEPAVYLGLYLGLRRSEVAGLRWKDVDFEKRVVHIRNTVVRFSSLSEEEKTKNPTSRRDLYLPDGLRDYLEGLPHDDPDGHVCSCKPDYISRRFHKVLERSGLPLVRFHDLRHTAGSMLINNGSTILQVQNFLGHKKASTTLDIYSHIYLEGKKKTAETIDSLLR